MLQLLLLWLMLPLWLLPTIAVLGRAAGELLREGDNYSVECGPADWRYCRWQLTGVFSCDRSKQASLVWCNQVVGFLYRTS